MRATVKRGRVAPVKTRSSTPSVVSVTSVQNGESGSFPSFRLHAPANNRRDPECFLIKGQLIVPSLRDSFFLCCIIDASMGSVRRGSGANRFRFFFRFFLVKIFPRSRRFGERIGWKFGGRGKDERIVLSSKEVYFRAKLVKRVICMRV